MVTEEQNHPAMLAYIYEGPCWCAGCDSADGTVVVVHAESRNAARYSISSHCDLDYEKTNVRRYEAMDGLPTTDSLMLKLGLFAWLECWGCPNRIYGVSGSVLDVQEFPHAKDGGPYSFPWTHDDGEDEDGEIVMALHAEGVGMFCSESCYAKWHGSKEWHAMRKRRGLGVEASNDAV